MAKTREKRGVYRRLSLAHSLPLVSLGLAVGLAGAFLLVSHISVELRARADSRAETERLASMVAKALSRSEMDYISASIQAYAPAEITVLSETGAVVASTRGQAPQAVFHVAPVIYDGNEIGAVAASRLRDGGLSMPVTAIFFLVLLACGLAFTSGHIFAQRVLGGLDRVVTAANALRTRRKDTDALNAPTDFVELREVNVAMRRAVASVQREADALRQEAFTDPATGLPNFSALIRALSGAIAQAQVSEPAALFCLDLDGFDRACESFGGGVGEVLMARAIARIEDELEQLSASGVLEISEITLAHPSGDSLYLLVSRLAGRGAASQVARALRSAFVPPLDACGYEVSLGVSGGIVMIPEDGTSTQDLIRRGESALKNVRRGAKQPFEFYVPSLDREASDRLQLEAEIREAIECGEFVPFFQPKLDLRTGRIRGCEALARWHRPGGSYTSPGLFIPIAEQTGLIDEIGHQILKGACASAVTWLKEGLCLDVAVNVSPVQLRNPNFRDRVLEVISETGLPPKSLELEITESVAVEDPEAFQEIINPLRAMGVRLALDDFGTGHSNLAILSRLNFDVFKIDQQFTQNLERDATARPIVEMILAMAESLGLETVAEGVETRSQARFLRQRGCTAGQGFLYSRPRPAAEFLTFARNWEDRRRQRRLARAV